MFQVQEAQVQEQVVVVGSAVLLHARTGSGDTDLQETKAHQAPMEKVASCYRITGREKKPEREKPEAKQKNVQ
jgi:hypothetical protein